MQLLIVWERVGRDKARLEGIVLDRFEAAPTSRADIIKALGEAVESLPNNVQTIKLYRPDEEGREP